jgi:hypothetical protein
MTSHYERGDILSYHELSEEQQRSVLSAYFEDVTECENTSYILCNGEALPIDHFERTTNSKMWHGIWSQSAFSAYFIRLSQDAERAVVAYRHF